MRRLFAPISLLGLFLLPSVGLAQPVPTVPDLTGKWSGYWVSDKNGHTGPLRATFVSQGPECYRVTYRGRFAAVIPFRYSTTMTEVGTGDGVVSLYAEKRLGPMGTFRTSAIVTNSSFNATFTSRRDSGRFVMSR
jgi:hypothetical protein